MVMAGLHAEHEELLPEIERLRSVAESLADPKPAMKEAVRTSYEFLTRRLIPHAEAEEDVLYPAVAEAMGSPQATKTMSRDHATVGHLTRELGELDEFLSHSKVDAWVIESVRRVLYGLYAVIKLHFAKEEESYLPLLDRSLSTDDAKRLVERMSRYAGNHPHEH